MNESTEVNGHPERGLLEGQSEPSGEMGWTALPTRRRLIVMPTVPACLACGTCCFSRLENYVRVTGKDYERLGERVDELVRFDGNRAYMRMADGHCSALELDPASMQFRCGAYAVRPEICRTLLRGSAECHAEIESKHSRPLIELGRLLAHRNEEAGSRRASTSS